MSCAIELSRSKLSLAQLGATAGGLERYGCPQLYKGVLFSPSPMKLSVAFCGLVAAFPTGQSVFDIVRTDDSVSVSWNFPWPPFLKPLVDSEKLQAHLTKGGLRERAETLYNISLSSVKEFGHPTRVIGSAGHNKTIAYIVEELERMGGYHVSVQRFNATNGIVKNVLLSIDGKPLKAHPFALSPPSEGLLEASLVLAKNLGCSSKDYPEAVKGNIVLVQRGECAFGIKSANAGKAGAAGLIIYDEDPASGTLGDPTGEEVPTVGVSTKNVERYIRALLKEPKAHISASIYVDSLVKTVSTLNVIAETTNGNHENVVSLGAHLDSVAAGPGINDDGSGTISLLEVASYLTKYKLKNAVRFAWWAAEEEGLLGLYAYARLLSAAENQKVRLFMDYDMMASPNYEYQIYDADNKHHPNGLGNLRDLYVDFYKSNNLNYTFVPFDGRSDYVGFIDAGIPAGGVATGAEGVKTKKGQAKFGGTAGEWFDPCYYQACDDLNNTDYKAWLVNTRLIAHSVATYARSLEGFPQRSNGTAAKLAYRGTHLVF